MLQNAGSVKGVTTSCDLLPSILEKSDIFISVEDVRLERGLCMQWWGGEDITDNNYIGFRVMYAMHHCNGMTMSTLDNILCVRLLRLGRSRYSGGGPR